MYIKLCQYSILHVTCSCLKKHQNVIFFCLEIYTCNLQSIGISDISMNLYRSINKKYITKAQGTLYLNWGVRVRGSKRLGCSRTGCRLEVILSKNKEVQNTLKDRFHVLNTENEILTLETAKI